MGRVQREARHRHRRGNREKSAVKFNVSNLRDGTYFLHIESNGEFHKEQIMISRWR
jgi:hypothetical protein